MQKLKVAIIGPGGCGKSAIAVRILSRRYINEYCPVLEDTYHRILSIDGVKVSQVYINDLKFDSKNNLKILLDVMDTSEPFGWWTDGDQARKLKPKLV